MRSLFLVITLIPTMLFSSNLTEIKSDNYTYYTDLNRDQISHIISFAESLNNELEVQFRSASNTKKRKVTVLRDRDSFNSYLKELEIDKRTDYTYAKFSNSDRNRVIIYIGHNKEKTSLAHHLTLQYLDTYLDDIPTWLKLGLATYYEEYREDTGVHKSNKWISTLKLRNDNFFTDLINEEEKKVSQDLSWLLVDFLYNSGNKEDIRLLWDTIGYIKWSTDKNKKEVIKNNFLEFNINTKLTNYISSLMGYSEYMDQGIKNYNSGNYKKAIVSFNHALDKDSTNYSPYYFLGLSYSKSKEYKKAYSHLSTAIDKGSPKDVTYYSIGLNFYASKEFKQAISYLRRTEAIVGSQYSLKAKEIINEIGKY